MMGNVQHPARLDRGTRRAQPPGAGRKALGDAALSKKKSVLKKS